MTFKERIRAIEDLRGTFDDADPDSKAGGWSCALEASLGDLHVLAAIDEGARNELMAMIDRVSTSYGADSEGLEAVGKSDEAHLAREICFGLVALNSILRGAA